MAKSYSQLWKDAESLGKEGEDVANFKETVTKLPYQLKDEFRKAGDPKLDQAINKAQSDTFGAAIKGLDMYKDISDPFARRSLAEQYQGGVEMGWKNLTDERTRRQGVYSDYITKWTGLFGAEAAKKQDLFNNKMSVWEKEKSLADTEESNRRWNIEQAQKNKTASQKDWTDQEIRSFVYSHKEDMTWDEQRSYLGELGVDVEQGGTFDVSANGAWETGNFPTRPKAENERTFADKNSELKYNEAVRDGNGTKETPYKDSGKAEYGDYYWSGTTKKKKVWGFDPEA